MSENVFINMKNRSHTITAEVEIPEGGANGVILAQAGRFGGWSLYLKDGKPTYTYNFLGLKPYKVAAPQALPPARRRSVWSSLMTAADWARAERRRCSSTGRKSPKVGLNTRRPIIFSADEGADVGMDGDAGDG